MHGQTRTVHDATGALVERVASLLHSGHFESWFSFGETAA